jgi:biopolymer transport protein ExbD
MKAEINVTPLVDIVLVLLIIFIVITPAVHHAVPLPTARHGAAPRPEPGAHYLTLVLPARRDPAGAVAGPGPVQVEGGAGAAFDLADPAGCRQLVGFVRASVARMGDRRVFIRADRALAFRHVDALLQLCREGGADEASVVTRDESEGSAGAPVRAPGTAKAGA